MSNSVKNFFEPVKILRDLVHGYISLTEFDLNVINTIPFQRLKDIRQLTCQHVYPSARHTRFEHSLGVMELTKKAIYHLNKNGFIDNRGKKRRTIDDTLLYNVSMAALLHDVGHCVFSHMGETQYDYDEVKQSLIDEIKIALVDENVKSLNNDIMHKICCTYNEVVSLVNHIENSEKAGAVHEQISCISILCNFLNILVNTGTDLIKADLVFIIRCILGLKYDVDTEKLMSKYGKKNALIGLINSSVFDMDKLDYIMRDSFFTGIGTPAIDTKRLFNNMYFDKDYNIVFTSKAVPALQSIIESRDGLYMYVYNHHTVIYTDFIYAYVVRRMTAAAETFVLLQNPRIKEKNELDEKLEDLMSNQLVSSLGLVSKPLLFSIGSIVDYSFSDSDFISLINILGTQSYYDLDIVKSVLLDKLGGAYASKDSFEELALRIKNTFSIMQRFRNRNLLMPWWKTVYEFTDFMRDNFPDENIKKELGTFICKGGKYGLKASLFRSQLAKHVIYVFNQFVQDNSLNSRMLLDGEFFIVQRSTRFFDLETIKTLQIALQSQRDIKEKYYTKPLNTVLPQKNYEAIYAKEGFYVYSPNQGIDNELLKKVFVFVAAKFISMGEQHFSSIFSPQKRKNMTLLKYDEMVSTNVKKSQKALYDDFCNICNN